MIEFLTLDKESLRFIEDIHWENPAQLSIQHQSNESDKVIYHCAYID